MKFFRPAAHVVSIVAPLALTLTVTAQTSQPPTPGRGITSQTNQQQTNSPAPATQPQPSIVITNAPTFTQSEPQARSKQSEGDKQSTANWWSSLATWIIASLTLAIVVTAFVTIGEARQAFFLTHRPRIVIRNVVMDGIGRGGGLDYQLKLSNGSMWIANIGENAAFVIRVWYGLYIFESLPMRNPANTATADDRSIIKIPPGGVYPVPLPELKIDTFSDFHALSETGKGNLFLIGYVKYRDRLKTFRRTYFCRKFNRETGRFEAVTDPDYEYAD